jgi:hypothetical protein
MYLSFLGCTLYEIQINEMSLQYIKKLKADQSHRGIRFVDKRY